MAKQSGQAVADRLGHWAHDDNDRDVVGQSGQAKCPPASYRATMSNARGTVTAPTQ